MVRRIVGWTAIVILGLVVVATATVFGVSQWRLYHARDMPLVALAVSPSAADAAEGYRMARIAGCAVCHGAQGRGRVFIPGGPIGRLIAPSLAVAATRYSDAEFARTIRHGIKRDGSPVVIMPSTDLVNLSDRDVANIIAWLRTLKPGAGDVQATTSYSLLARALVVAGKFPIEAVPASVPSPRERPADIGHYLVSSVCSGCHSLARPEPFAGTNEIAPALAPIGAAYDDAAFMALMRTGRTAGGQKLGVMKEVTDSAGRAFTDAEIVAIHGYLKRVAAALPPE